MTSIYKMKIFHFKRNIPEVAPEVIKVCGVTLPLAAVHLPRLLHAGPVDGGLAEEEAQVFGPRLQAPRRQVQRHGQSLVREDGGQHHRL